MSIKGWLFVIIVIFLKQSILFILPSFIWAIIRWRLYTKHVLSIIAWWFHWSITCILVCLIKRILKMHSLPLVVYAIYLLIKWWLYKLWSWRNRIFYKMRLIYFIKLLSDILKNSVWTLWWMILPILLILLLYHWLLLICIILGKRLISLWMFLSSCCPWVKKVIHWLKCSATLTC